MPKSNEFVYLKDKELKKAEKIRSRLKKITLVSYKDSLMYYLYNRDSDFIIVSCSVNINKDKMLTEKSTKAADETLVSTNKIKTLLLIDEIIEISSSITKLAKIFLLVIKTANLDHITPSVVKNREIINNSSSRALILSQDMKDSSKRKL